MPYFYGLLKQIFQKPTRVIPRIIITGMLFFFIAAIPWNSQAQRQVGGPYQADSSTVLLMHFNGDFTNESDSSADGKAHGKVNFVDAGNLGLPDTLGQAIRINNQSQSDSSWVMVPDTAALDLTGAWTIEFWVNVFTYADSAGDHRFQPRLVNKPGDPWYQANYWLYARGEQGGERNFWTGYREDVGGSGSYVEITSPPNTLVPGNWYHFAFMRDTTNHFLVQLIHKLNPDGTLERISFGTLGYDPVTQSPPTPSDRPLLIGSAVQEDMGAGGMDHRLDGYMDELRISTTVRNYSIPPVISGVTTLGNQPAGGTYDISTNITTLGDVSLSSATLHYRVNGGSWQTATMAEGANGYTGTINGQNTTAGDIIEYYVTSTDVEGRKAYNPSSAKQDTNANYYQFGVWEPQSKTLHLSFESGSGAPVDSSQYKNDVAIFGGDTTYSTDAAVGSYSLNLSDTTHLVVDSPFLTSNRLRAEIWFKPDTLIGGRRILVSPSSPWYQANSQIWFANDTQIEAGGYFPESTLGYVETVQDSSIMVDKWYKAVYQVMPDSIMLEIWDANHNLISRTFTNHGGTVPVQASQPFYIGDTPAGTHDFSGLVDEIKMYNYAKDTTFTAIENDRSPLPRDITLAQNYPNPFNPTTNITYKLPYATDVNLAVYNTLGRKIKTLVNSTKKAGTHTVQFKAHGLASGVYFYRLKADGVTRTHKMLLMK